MRYFIEIAYNGKNYFGWQRQPNQITVQQVVEEAVSTLLRTEIKITAAGRTDTGVHALQLYAHFDHDPIENKNGLVFRLNSLLPQDISIRDILEVADDAHARFDAIKREYEYHVSLWKNPFNSDLAYQLHRKPNLELMNLAAEMLLHHKDFQCFSRSRTDVKTYDCNIETAIWEERDNSLVFTIIANRFLRNMVRAIVGTLLDIGFGRTNLEDFQNILGSKDRREAGPSAPAQGLYLKRVEYPSAIFLNK